MRKVVLSIITALAALTLTVGPVLTGDAAASCGSCWQTNQQ